jgi:superkiller protein 3
MIMCLVSFTTLTKAELEISTWSPWKEVGYNIFLSTANTNVKDIYNRNWIYTWRIKNNNAERVEGYIRIRGIDADGKVVETNYIMDRFYIDGGKSTGGWTEFTLGAIRLLDYQMMSLKIGSRIVVEAEDERQTRIAEEERKAKQNAEQLAREKAEREAKLKADREAWEQQQQNERERNAREREKRRIAQQEAARKQREEATRREAERRQEITRKLDAQLKAINDYRDTISESITSFFNYIDKSNDVKKKRDEEMKAIDKLDLYDGLVGDEMNSAVQKVLSTMRREVRTRATLELDEYSLGDYQQKLSVMEKRYGNDLVLRVNVDMARSNLIAQEINTKRSRKNYNEAQQELTRAIDKLEQVKAQVLARQQTEQQQQWELEEPVRQKAIEHENLVKLARNNPELASAIQAQKSGGLTIPESNNSSRDGTGLPKDDKGWYDLGRALAAKKEYQQAEVAYREAMRLQPDNANYPNAVGWVLMNQGKNVEAEPLFREAIRLNANWHGFYTNLGVVLMRQKKYIKAEETFREAVRLMPDDAGNLFDLGYALSAQQKYQQAETAFREAIRLKPDDANYHDRLGYVLSEQQKFQQAEAVYREAMRLQPNISYYSYMVGSMLFQQKKYSDAEVAFKDAIRLKPTSTCYYMLGEVYIALNKYPEAEVSYRDALKLAPDAPYYLGSLGYVLLQQQKYIEAEATYREAIRFKPNEAVYHRGLGEVLYQQKKYSDAIKSFEEAIRLAPATDWLKNRLDNARKALEE